MLLHLRVIWLIWKRLCVCQVSTEGTGSRGQTGHSDNGQKCADFTFTSSSGSSLDHPNITLRWRLRGHSKYNCIYCRTAFTDMHQLLRHITTMHNGRQFVCPQCQRSYDTKNELKEHVDKTHNKLYRYRCELCGKCFFARSLYLDHVAAHTGVERYTCSTCAMKFTNKSALKTHVLKFHPGEASNIL